MIDSFDIPPIPDESYQHSPFTPSFGVIPPRLADRQQFVNAFARILDQGPGAHRRATLITGQRGMGKSVMLRVFQDVAHSRGWLSAHAQASPGFVERLTRSRIPEALNSLNVRSEDRFPISAGFEHLLTQAAELLADRGSGLLITLDEVHRPSFDELRQIIDAISTAVTHGAPIVFSAAGLPPSINDLVSDGVSTYLSRAQRIDVGALTDVGTREGLVRPLEQAGKTITPGALQLAVESSGRYPYLTQLIGDESFRQAGASTTITLDHVQAAVREA